MRALLIPLLACGLSTAVDDAKPKDDLAKLQGTWKGKGGSGDKEFKVTLVVKDANAETTIVTAEGDERKGKAKLKLDEKASPKELDFVEVNDGENLRNAPPLIYELKGDTLKLCGGHNGSSPRPAEFKDGGEGADFTVVITLTRQKE